jgi:hypothetical protein
VFSSTSVSYWVFSSLRPHCHHFACPTSVSCVSSAPDYSNLKKSAGSSSFICAMGFFAILYTLSIIRSIGIRTRSLASLLK